MISFLFSVTPSDSILAQGCPPNLDFETGTFAGWTCYTGFTESLGNQNEITLTPSNGPVPDRHTMFSSYPPGAGLDFYGEFPINCPNGSGHSIKLGNETGGGQAEGISYEFTIPANQDYYSLIYNYAVVFEDPAHELSEQPRLVLEILNVTDNRIIDCSSFTFFPNGSPLPGFELSLSSQSETPVWYKSWTAVSINLDGQAGKTIRLFFKTGDCTFQRHFGYAYLDVNTDCSGSFVGASFCPDDTAVNVVAPYGYRAYNWYNNDFSQLLGQGQTLTLAPPPTVGTTIAVILFPYDGYGCKDTLYAELRDDLSVVARAGNDTVSCNNNPVQIGALPEPNIVYKWKPPIALSDTDISNPFATPPSTSTYVLTARSRGGGCVTTDTVTVIAASLDNTLFFSGTDSYCTGSGDFALLSVLPTDSIQWYRDGIAITGANEVQYNVLQTGLYHARLFDFDGCTLNTIARQINVATVPVASVSVNDAEQCYIGNRFLFTNNSSNAVGGMQYRWSLGNGIETITKDIDYSYPAPGTYIVKMFVSSNTICIDSTVFTVRVHPNIHPVFSAMPVCVNLPMQVLNNTVDTGNAIVNYLWDFGNGQFSNVKTPPAQFYNTPGLYTVSLSVSSSQCPTPVLSTQQNILVDAPRPGTTYPEEVAVVNLPLELQARPFGETVLWTPAINLSSNNSFTPVFRGSTETLYRIEIKTRSGCTTVDTQLVKVVKRIEIFVPSAFTPNSDGLNDILRPTMFGIKTLNYFKVFNRWGQLLFQTKALKAGWDGTFKGLPLAPQAYIWMVEGIGADGNLHSKKGSSILIR